ncbi:MAG: hypothetical protein AB8I08_22965 [Sandaracinaceae bacterium]
MTRHALWLGLAVFISSVGCGSNSEEPTADRVPAEPDETATVEEAEAEAETPDAPTETADGVRLVGPLVLGESVDITVPPVPGAEGQRQYSLAIAAGHGVRCDAHAEHEGEGRDAQMALYRDDERIAANSDAGEGFDARIDFEAEPGTYGVRVWEWLHRDATLTLTCIRHEVPEPEAAEPSVE